MAQIEKIMSIYYGHDKLPYKDIDRQIHYPIVGDSNTFIGENNTTKVRFFVDRIGGTQFTWLATIKKPDGSLCYEVLDSETIAEGYVDLSLADIYLDQQGAVYIGLTGYTAQELNITENNGVYVINGNPQRLVTGAIKIVVNYAPQTLNIGTDISYSQYQQILAQLSKKLGLGQALVFYGDITDIQSTEIATSDLTNGQIVYDEATNWFYSWNTSTSSFSPIALKGKTNIYSVIPTTEYDETVTIATLISNGYSDHFFCVRDYLSTKSSYIYHIDTTNKKVVRFNIENFTIQERVYGDNTNFTLRSAFDLVNVTTYYLEKSNLKATSINSGNVNSTNYYPSTKATADYVKANAIESFTFDSSTYQIKFFNGNGTQVGSTIDLPVENVVVSGSYNNTTKKLVLTLANGNTIEINIGDLVSGLVATSDIADNLTTNDSTKVLSAKQGKVLNDTKVNKTSDAFKVYATSLDGSQTTISYLNGNNAYSIPQRDGSGNIQVGATPANNNDATSKTYVDTNCEKVANKTTTLSSSSTDTQYPSAKVVYDNLKEIREIANGCSSSYLAPIDTISESDLQEMAGEGLVCYVDTSTHEIKEFASTSAFNTWVSGKTFDMSFLTSANQKIILSGSNFSSKYWVVYKNDLFIVVDYTTYDILFKDGDTIFVGGEYFDRWYFSNVLELYNDSTPIISESAISGATPSLNIISTSSYMCSSALTSLTITGLTTTINDLNPTWQISFKTHASTSFTITLPIGVSWANGTPTFYLDTEYTIVIKKSVVSGNYLAYLL